VFGVSTLVRSTVGFGEALIAVPLLAFVLPVDVVAPIAMLISITVALIVVVQDWRHVHMRAAGQLVLSSLAGIPLGVLILRHVPEALVKGTLGLVVAGFSLSYFLSDGWPALENDRLAWVFGAGAGILGGAYGLNGPPLVVYGSLRRWSPERFRATLQGYFLPASVAGMIGYWIAGLWTPAVTSYYLLTLPVVLISIGLGVWLSRRLRPERFLVYVHACLIAVGGALLVEAIAAAWR
jgi:uncharacterized membrane protein YfcA